MSLKRRLAAAVSALAIAVPGLIAVETAAGTSAADAATLCRSYVYSTGGSGTCVKDLQIIVGTFNKFFAYDPAKQPLLTADGAFGPQTKAAVVSYQRTWSYAYGLTVDGIVGPKTWAALCENGNMDLYKRDGFTQANANSFAAAFLAACGKTAHVYYYSL